MAPAFPQEEERRIDGRVPEQGDRDERCRPQSNDPDGREPFLRLSSKDGDPNSTDASYWRIIHCPMGPGHVLYLKSELTQGRWRIYSDNIAMARWLQKTVQGMLNAELKMSRFRSPMPHSQVGRPALFLDRTRSATDAEIALTWYDIGRTASHSHPAQPAAEPATLRRLHATHPRAWARS
jgi:hypothetical protein